jgi:hypothetical protein
MPAPYIGTQGRHEVPRTRQEHTMLHGPARDTGPDPASRYKARLGVVMCIIYSFIYAGFVLANVVAEGRAMQHIVALGLNLATVYGMGLIILALLLALVYNGLCARKERELGGSRPRTEEAAR